ncbi:hypothetical protein ACOSB0_00105, partial [Candidatus Phytoplasma citri]
FTPKPAYEMCSGDLSCDVCSCDLVTISKVQTYAIVKFEERERERERERETKVVANDCDIKNG